MTFNLTTLKLSAINCKVLFEEDESPFKANFHRVNRFVLFFKFLSSHFRFAI